MLRSLLPVVRPVFVTRRGLAGLFLGAVASIGFAQPAENPSTRAAAAEEGRLRVATFNVSLYGDREDALRSELRGGNSPRAGRVAAILQRVRPDIVLLNEIDYRADGAVVRSLVEEYLARPQPAPGGGETEPLRYAHVYSGPVNTGVDSGLDLNRNGRRGEPEDAWGYGRYPGQYGMAVLSRFPIEAAAVRTFQQFRWAQLPDAQRPTLPDGTPYYDDVTWQQLRLSSKSHWDVPIDVRGRTVHLLASHPTPPAFDGPEDRNGCRNADEIRFWMHYIGGAGTTADLRDDQDRVGWLPEEASFVIAGDLNCDPHDGSGRQTAIRQLLEHPRVRDPQPHSRGGSAAAQRRGGANRAHRGDARYDTSQFSAEQVGNLRVDYCLPSSNLRVLDSGVYWPERGEPGAELVEVSDHRLVWVDVALGPQPERSTP
jgi:endonuclease/exonuclease/phosphatase family metal-dependent hydrolase